MELCKDQCFCMGEGEKKTKTERSGEERKSDFEGFRSISFMATSSNVVDRLLEK